MFSLLLAVHLAAPIQPPERRVRPREPAVPTVKDEPQSDEEQGRSRHREPSQDAADGQVTDQDGEQEHRA